MTLQAQTEADKCENTEMKDVNVRCRGIGKLQSDSLQSVGAVPVDQTVRNISDNVYTDTRRKMHLLD